MNKPIVTVKQGKLRGATVKSVLGSSYIAFYEIPFVAPPIGKLRFKDPEPSPPWMGIRDASVCMGSICIQTEERPPYNIIGKEDCLYLNVYTNSLTQSKPVMFWIHGGGFSTGTASYRLVKPDYLLTKDVVIVAANYRLGAFGFLNLGHRAAPGNQGLKDLIAALQWVKNNIANFGGDPNNVTLFGQSAGAVLTHALTISPSARGLFHKAIIQSGNLLCPWGFRQSCPERGFKLAKLLGITSTDPEEIVELLRGISEKDIVKTQPSVLSNQVVGYLNLAFGVNYDEMAENPVLPMQIEQLCSNGDNIPIMVGYLEHESVMFINDAMLEALKSHKLSILEYVKILEGIKKVESMEIEKLLKIVKDRYFDGEPSNENRTDLFVRFTTDIYFAIPLKLQIEDRMRRSSAPNYFYKFSHFGKETSYTDLVVKRCIDGASHMDELSYLFYSPLCKYGNPAPPATGTKDREIMERMTTMWTNFAKTGNPTPILNDLIKTTWEPVTKDKFNYLEIGKETELLIMEPHVLSSK